MATASFPEGVPPDFPPEEPPNPIVTIIGTRIKRISDLFGAIEEEREDGEL